jgi:hypothetical protein
MCQGCVKTPGGQARAPHCPSLEARLGWDLRAPPMSSAPCRGVPQAGLLCGLEGQVGAPHHLSHWLLSLTSPPWRARLAPHITAGRRRQELGASGEDAGEVRVRGEEDWAAPYAWDEHPCEGGMEAGDLLAGLEAHSAAKASFLLPSGLVPS